MPAINLVFTGGVYSIQNLGLISFSLILTELKHFIIQDDSQIVDKILIGIEKMDKKDDKVTLCKIKFNLGACKHLTEDEINSLSETGRNFFYFIQAFGIKVKLRGFVNIWMVEDGLQDLESGIVLLVKLFYHAYYI